MRCEFLTDSPKKARLKQRDSGFHKVNTSSKLNCYDVFRAQGWRVVPLIRLARLAVRLAQVCECSFNHTNPNSNLKDKVTSHAVKSTLILVFKLGVQFSSQSESADRDRWINLTLEASNEVCGSIYYFCTCPGIFSSFHGVFCN